MGSSFAPRGRVRIEQNGLLVPEKNHVNSSALRSTSKTIKAVWLVLGKQLSSTLCFVMFCPLPSPTIYHKKNHPLLRCLVFQPKGQIRVDAQPDGVGHDDLFAMFKKTHGGTRGGTRGDGFSYFEIQVDIGRWKILQKHDRRWFVFHVCSYFVQATAPFPCECVCVIAMVNPSRSHLHHLAKMVILSKKGCRAMRCAQPSS